MPYGFTWADFKVPEWGDPAAPAELDPAQVVSIAINFGGEAAQEGTFWIDRVGLGSAEQAAPQAADQAQPVQQEQSETSDEESQGVGGFINGMCPLSTAMIPMTMAVTLFLQFRRRKQA